MKNESFIYVVKEASFDIDGDKYDMANVSFVASIGGIPQCTVGIAPNDGSGSIIINSLDIVSLKDAFEALSKKAIALAKSNLKVTLSVTSAGGKGGSSMDDQTLELKDWKLVNVGLSHLTTTMPFSITCTIAHPAFILTTRGGFYFDASGTLKFDDTCDQATNPLDAAQVAIDTVLTANEEKIATVCEEVQMATKLKSPKEINDSLEEATKALKSEMQHGEYLVWDPEFSGASYDLPMQDKLTGVYEHGLKYALVSAWIPDDRNSSVWDILQRNVCPQFALEIAATWDKKTLSLVPVMPWKTPSYHINDYMVQEVVFPGMDPDPIYGCILYEGPGAAPPAASITFEEGSAEATAMQPSNLAFIPEDSKDSVGRLWHCGPGPAWLDLAMEKATAATPIDVEATGDITFDEEISEPEHASAGDNHDLEIWNAAKMMHLYSLFMQAYRSRVEANTICAFFTKCDGEYVIPGKVGDFITGGKALFSGLITTIEHFIDCARSTAYTKINFAYCQAPDANDNVLGANPVCPYYAAQGD